MPKIFTILVADRNGNVRDFLKREFTAEGYRVLVAKDGPEVLGAISSSAPPHLLVLDPEVPFLDESGILGRLAGFSPPIPLVIYTLLNEYGGHPAASGAAALVEKKDDVEHLKKEVADALKKYYPQASSSNVPQAGGASPA